MDLRALVEARATAYRAIQARAGVSLRCLDPDAAAAPPITSLTAGADGDARALTVRVQGPLDDWFGFDVRALISDLDEAAPQSIHLLIESPGGFLSDGLALYNDLRARARSGVTVTAEARGVVASAAVLPFLAAETRTMTTGTELMVHNPWSLLLLAGTADDIEDTVTKAVAAGFATAVIEDTAAATTAQDAQARALAQRVLARWRLTHVQRQEMVSA